MPFSLLFIENERVATQGGLEMSPLVIREVQYNPLSRVNHNDILLQMLNLSTDQIVQLVSRLSSEM